MSKHSILVDLNILIDVLQKREPFFQNSAKIVDLVADQTVKGFIAAHSITTLFYILEKAQNHAVAHSVIAQLLLSFSVAPINEAVIQQALQLGWKDFEDAVQMTSATSENIDFLITRNSKDFQTQLIPVLTPNQFLILQDS